MDTRSSLRGADVRAALAERPIVTACAWCPDSQAVPQSHVSMRLWELRHQPMLPGPRESPTEEPHAASNGASFVPPEERRIVERVAELPRERPKKIVIAILWYRASRGKNTYFCNKGLGTTKAITISTPAMQTLLRDLCAP